VTGQPDGDLLVVGWGSTYGAIAAAVKQASDEGYSVSQLALAAPQPIAAKNLAVTFSNVSDACLSRRTTWDN
jgi:2-oxoglutarate/2-oxoacid ferredoxin oxidoreductase subunit alpha